MPEQVMLLYTQYLAEGDVQRLNVLLSDFGGASNQIMYRGLSPMKITGVQISNISVAAAEESELHYLEFVTDNPYFWDAGGKVVRFVRLNLIDGFWKVVSIASSP